MQAAYVETDCTISHEGRTYEAGGSVLLNCTDGKVRGVVYVNDRDHTVTTWHGERIAFATWTDSRGNFCKMRRVSFTYAGIRIIGEYCPDWSQMVRVRSTKPARLPEG